MPAFCACHLSSLARTMSSTSCSWQCCFVQGTRKCTAPCMSVWIREISPGGCLVCSLP